MDSNTSELTYAHLQAIDISSDFSCFIGFPVCAGLYDSLVAFQLKFDLIIFRFFLGNSIYRVSNF